MQTPRDASFAIVNGGETTMKNPFPSSTVTYNFASFIVEETVMKSPFPTATDLKAVLFDVDGTLCDSDPLHYLTFREMLQEIGYHGGVPISEEFYREKISGRENYHIGLGLFPDWQQGRRDEFLSDREARFRKLAAQLLKPVEGLGGLCRWIEARGLKRAAVTNSTRANAELMISLLGLSSFFDVLVVGEECERPKPYPDPYQKALKHFGLQPDQAIVLEDSPTGIRAAVAAGVATAGVATRNAEASLFEAGAAIAIADFNDIRLWNALGAQPENTLN